MIIVEGPDGAGKTTLIKKIESMFELKVEPRAVSKDAEKLTPIGEYIEAELEKGFGWRLYDRFALISSPMYNMLPNPTFSDQLLDMGWLTEQYERFHQIKPSIIYCMPPIDRVIENVFSHPDNKVVQPHIRQIYNNYLAFVARGLGQSMGTSMVWDYTHPDPLRLKSLITWSKGRVERGK